MAPEQIKTSFIPKKSFTETTVRAARESTLGILMLVSLIIFGVSVVAFAGAYGYRFWLSDAINRPCQADSNQGCGLVATLEYERQELQIDRIVRFSRLDTKMKTASSIIGNHVTVLPLLDLLQDLTISTIRYTRLTYSPEGVVLDGTAFGYEDIAVQAQAFEESGRIREASFSGLGLDSNGNVTFSLALSVDPSVFSFRNYIEERNARIQQQQTTAPQTTETESGDTESGESGAGEGGNSIIEF